MKPPGPEDPVSASVIEDPELVDWLLIDRTGRPGAATFTFGAPVVSSRYLDGNF